MSSADANSLQNAIPMILGHPPAGDVSSDGGQRAAAIAARLASGSAMEARDSVLSGDAQTPSSDGCSGGCCCFHSCALSRESDVTFIKRQRYLHQMLAALARQFPEWGRHEASFIWHIGTLLSAQSLKDLNPYWLSLEEVWNLAVEEVMRRRAASQPPRPVLLVGETGANQESTALGFARAVKAEALDSPANQTQAPPEGEEEEAQTATPARGVADLGPSPNDSSVSPVEALNKSTVRQLLPSRWELDSEECGVEVLANAMGSVDQNRILQALSMLDMYRVKFDSSFVPKAVMNRSKLPPNLEQFPTLARHMGVPGVGMGGPSIPRNRKAGALPESVAPRQLAEAKQRARMKALGVKVEDEKGDGEASRPAGDAASSQQWAPGTNGVEKVREEDEEVDTAVNGNATTVADDGSSSSAQSAQDLLAIKHAQMALVQQKVNAAAKAARKRASTAPPRNKKPAKKSKRAGEGSSQLDGTAVEGGLKEEDGADAGESGTPLPLSEYPSGSQSLGTTPGFDPGAATPQAVAGPVSRRSELLSVHGTPPSGGTPAGNGAPSSMDVPPKNDESYKSHVKGVYYDDSSHRWCASWHERKSGKKKSRYFAVKKFGFWEAKNHAMEARLKAEETGECAPTNIY